MSSRCSHSDTALVQGNKRGEGARAGERVAISPDRNMKMAEQAVGSGFGADLREQLWQVLQVPALCFRGTPTRASHDRTLPSPRAKALRAEAS